MQGRYLPISTCCWNLGAGLLWKRTYPMKSFAMSVCLAPNSVRTEVRAQVNCG